MALKNSLNAREESALKPIRRFFNKESSLKFIGLNEKNIFLVSVDIFETKKKQTIYKFLFIKSVKRAVTDMYNNIYR